MELYIFSFIGWKNPKLFHPEVFTMLYSAETLEEAAGAATEFSLKIFTREKGFYRTNVQVQKQDREVIEATVKGGRVVLKQDWQEKIGYKNGKKIVSDRADATG